MNERKGNYCIVPLDTPRDFLWHTTSTATYNQQPPTTNATTYNKDKMPQAFLDMQERRVDLPSGSSKRGCGGGGNDGWSSRDQQLPRDRCHLVAHNRRWREYSHRRDHGRGGGRIDSRGDGWNRSTLPSPQMNGDRHHRCCHRNLSPVMTSGP